MCYVHNQWYDISCATLHIATCVDNRIFDTSVFMTVLVFIAAILLSLTEPRKGHADGWMDGPKTHTVLQ